MDSKLPQYLRMSIFFKTKVEKEKKRTNAKKTFGFFLGQNRLWEGKGRRRRNWWKDISPRTVFAVVKNKTKTYQCKIKYSLKIPHWKYEDEMKMFSDKH